MYASCGGAGWVTAPGRSRTEPLTCRDPRIQGSGDPGIQGSQDPWVQGFGASGMQDQGIQEFRIKGFRNPGSGNLGILESRNADMQGSRIQESRDPEMQGFKNPEIEGSSKSHDIHHPGASLRGFKFNVILSKGFDFWRHFTQRVRALG